MLIFDSQYFDPKATIESGQLFRYDKLGEGDYNVYTLDKKCRLTKNGATVRIESDDENYFKTFFDLDTDYQSINDTLLGFDELKNAASFGGGIRILKQDLLECVVSFIISQNNNIPRIKGIIDRLCNRYGELQDGYCSFPTLDRLSDISINEFRELGAGFRDKYLYNTIKILAETDILDRLKNSDSDCAFKMLCSLYGIGAKVADCIMLFGLGRMERFPVDTWMYKACKTQTLDTPLKVKQFYENRYQSLAGIAQQYIFYYIRENKFF